MKKTFSTAQIISVTTGRFVCPPIDNLYEILDFLTGEGNIRRGLQ
jgi:hypothetical protein